MFKKNSDRKSRRDRLPGHQDRAPDRDRDGAVCPKPTLMRSTSKWPRAVLIGPPTAAESYLLIDKIVEACRRPAPRPYIPATASCPSARRFRASRQGGHRLHRPQSRRHRRDGDKIESKKAAAKAKVSTCRASRCDRGRKHAAQIAEEIGYPVMIKASAGGAAGHADRASKRSRRRLHVSKAEAKSSFGDDRVFIEKFIVDPRHIEIQVSATSTAT